MNGLNGGDKYRRRPAEGWVYCCLGKDYYLTNRPLCLSSADPLAAKLHGILTDEAFEFYCSQCHRQINRLEDLSARLNDLEKNR